MQASELIARLQILIAKHGNCEVNYEENEIEKVEWFNAGDIYPERSVCCDALIKWTDICESCGEHCSPQTYESFIGLS